MIERYDTGDKPDPWERVVPWLGVAAVVGLLLTWATT